MKNLHLSSQLAVPLDLVTEKLAWIGVTGSGKSYGASKTAEELWHAHAQFVVLDPVGVWYGLRLAKDGKSAGIPIPVFGGLHGDVPLEASAGALVADLIVDKDLSAVIDVSQFDTDADKARFVSAFADRLFHRRKSAPAAMHVFLEECQEFVPQNPQPGEQMMLHRLHRLQKLGRNFGIGTSLITQRPQETSKKALNQAQTVFVFRLTGSQERKAIEAWVNEHGVEENLLDGLPKMETGTCHVWSPAWLKVFKTIRIAPKATFDASATPKVGVRAEARTLGTIDLEKLKADMKSTIEKAKEDDPKELRRRIQELMQANANHARHGATAAITLAPSPKIQRVEVPALTAKEQDRLEKLTGRAEKLIDAATVAAREAAAIAEKGRAALAAARAPQRTGVIEHASVKPAQPILRHATAGEMQSIPAWRAPIKIERGQIGQVVNAEILGKGERNTLTAIAQHGAKGVSRSQLTILTGYKRSTRNLYVQHLAAAGFVLCAGEQVTATGNGVDALGADFQPLPTGAALREHWLRTLPEGEKRVLEVAVARYPDSIEREALSQETGYMRSTRNLYVQRLAARGLLAARGTVVSASEMLF